MNGLIKNAGYKPRYRKCKMKWENTLYMGIELELEKYHGSDDTITNITEKLNTIVKKLKNNVFYYKNDSSIQYGVEMVSHPLTLQYVHNKLNLERIFNVIKELGLKDNDSCGLHIHLNKSFFSKKELYKLRLFFSKNQNKIIKLSRRSAHKIDQWCKYEKSYKIKTFLNDKKINGEMSKNEATRGYACAIFCNNPKTVEFRAFASTTNYKTFLATLQFCDALAHYLKSISIVFISEKNSWSYFVKWCKNQKRYNILLDYLKLKRINE